MTSYLVIAIIWCFVEGGSSLSFSYSVGSSRYTVPNTAGVPTYKYVPDGHLSSVLVNGQWYSFWSEYENYRTLGVSAYFENLETLDPSYAIFGSRTYPECGSNDGGSWLMNVFVPNGNGSTYMIGFYHQEDWYCGYSNPDNMAWKSIGMAMSYDLGKTWTDHGTIITSWQTQPSSPAWGGAGDNSAFYEASNKAYYMFYQELDADGASRLHAAKTSDPNAWPGNWFKWQSPGGFIIPGLGGQGDPIPLPSGSPQGANPSVHWNDAVGKYVMVYGGWDGRIYITACSDLEKQDWERPEAAVGPTIAVGAAWYPTIISDSPGGDQRSSSSAHLYYADMNEDKSSRVFAWRTIDFW
ncbi:hypothetical protein Pelo_3464 [Pelomyxa schiedti]|nr:hypothetical protein Pelo_3464 [Pelomyxa schiedti]